MGRALQIIQKMDRELIIDEKKLEYNLTRKDINLLQQQIDLIDNAIEDRKRQIDLLIQQKDSLAGEILNKLK